VSGNCTNGIIFTVERSTTNSPLSVWLPIGVYTGAPLIDSGLPLSQTTYYYRVTLSGQGVLNCTMNCQNPTVAAATSPQCCAYTMNLPNPAPVVPPGQSSVTFNVTFTANLNGCLADSPPATITSVTTTQPGVTVTIGAGSGTPANYVIPVTLSNIDTSLSLSLNIEAVVTCSGVILRRNNYAFAAQPSCCGASSITPGSLNSPNRLYPNYPNVLPNVVPGTVFMNGTIADPLFAGLKPPIPSSTPFNSFSAWSTANDSAVITPIPGTEDEYQLNITIPIPNTCGGNQFDLVIKEMFGAWIDNQTDSPNLHDVINSRYSKLRMIMPNYHSLFNNVDTFWHHYPETPPSLPGNARQVLAVYGGPTFGTYPHYPLSNTPTTTPYIISHTVSGGTFNPTNGAVTIFSNTIFTLSLRMRFPIQKGQGVSPQLRSLGSTFVDNQYLSSKYDRYFSLELLPSGSNPSCNAQGFTCFRLNHCNQKLRGTITGLSGGVNINAVKVWNGGGLNSLTPTLNIPATVEPTGKGRVTREFSINGDGEAVLFQLNRDKDYNVPTDHIPMVNNHWYAETTATTGPATEVSIFSNKEAFRQGAYVPFRLINFSQPGFNNRVVNLAVPTYSHLISYELTKLIETNFTTIFPASNVGAWSTLGNGTTGFSAGGTPTLFPANAYTIDMNMNPIIDFLKSRLVDANDMAPCCGFNFSSFKLSLLLYMEVGVMHGYAYDSTKIKKGRGRFVPLSTSATGITPEIDTFVTAPTALVVELDINLNTKVINNITYREKQLISTHTLPLITADMVSCAGYGYTLVNQMPMNKAWRIQPFDISITQPIPNILRFTNSSPIQTISHPNRPGGFKPLRSASQVPVTNYMDVLFLCPNLMITTMNLCPRYSAAPDLTNFECNCDYNNTIYSPLGNNSEVHVINPRIKGEVISSIGRALSNTAWGGQSFGAYKPPVAAAASPITINGVTFSLTEFKATLTSPYCNITTLPIALSVLARDFPNPGRADFLL
jgi:hypothetical protein